jgi:hypothetical protein
MTVYEHAMLGGTLALAVGLHRRHGWRGVGMACVAAALPDADGLSLLAGPTAYARAHRVLGHNLIAATALGLLAGSAGYFAARSARAQRAAAALLARLASDVKVSADARPFAWRDLLLWTVFGLVAALSHLPADIVYSGHPDLPPWPVPLLWPFSNQGWQLPIVPWGDVVTTVLFAVEMFALYRWPARAQPIAVATLAAVAGYVAVRYLIQSGLLSGG